VSAALDLLYGLVLEDGRTWGEASVAVQRADAAAVLDDAADERFHFVTRSRGYSKTTDLGGVAVAALLAQAPPGSKSYAVAADRDQARLLLDSVEGFHRRTPGLTELVDVAEWRVTARATGATLEAVAADSAGLWGLRPFLVVADELAQWGSTGRPRRVFDAVATAVPKTSGRLVVITTAGSPGHWSKKVRDHAKVHRLWRLSETPGPPPWMSREMVEEARSRLPPSAFARLFLNEWTAAEDVFATEEDVAACAVLPGPLAPDVGRHYVVGLDVGVVNDRTCAVVAHADPVERLLDDRTVVSEVRVVVDRVKTWSGSRANPVRLADVGDWLQFTSQQYRNAAVVYDPWQSVELAQRLQSAGVPVEQFNFTQASVGKLALTLYELLRARRLALPESDGLLDELRTVRLLEKSPGIYRIDHDPGNHDDQVIALSLAAHCLVEKRTAPAQASSGGSAREPWMRPDTSWGTPQLVNASFRF
jgi:phage terminase large subunit-like protein